MKNGRFSLPSFSWAKSDSYKLERYHTAEPITQREQYPSVRLLSLFMTHTSFFVRSQQRFFCPPPTTHHPKMNANQNDQLAQTNAIKVVLATGGVHLVDRASATAGDIVTDCARAVGIGPSTMR